MDADGTADERRPATWTWTKDLGGGTGVHFYDLDLAYDEGSNILLTEDNVHTAGTSGSGSVLFDAAYTLDLLGRLTRAKEGHWDGSAVTNVNTTRDEVWTLTQTGNWDLFRRDLNGDLDYADSIPDELSDRRTHNLANELTARNTDDTGGNEYALTYDAVGNMTDDGQHYTYKWDAFRRLKEVRNRSTTALVAEYRYNGLYWRSASLEDTDPPVDGVLDEKGLYYYLIGPVAGLGVG